MAENTFTYDSTTNKYLDLNGLKYYDGKIKNYVGTTLTNALGSYYTIDAADAKFATISALEAYQNSVSSDIAAGVSAKALWDAFLADYTDDKTSPAPTLQAIKNFMAEVKKDYATTDALNSAIDDLASVYVSQESYATDKDTLTNSIGAVDAKAVQNAADIAALTTTVADNATAATNAINAVDAKAIQNAADITALTSTVTANKEAAEAAIGAVDAKAEQNKSDIAALTTTVADNATAASNALAAAKGELEGSIAAVGAKADKNATDIETLKNGLSGAVHFRGVITPDEDGNWDLADKANGDIVIVDGAEYVYVEASDSWEKLGDTTSETNRISALETTVAQHTTDIAANATAISTLDTKVDGIKDDLTNAIDAIDDKAEQNKSDIAANATAISTLDTKVEGYNTTLSNGIAANGTAITALDEKVDGIKDDLASDIADCVKLADFITTTEIDALFA